MSGNGTALYDSIIEISKKVDNCEPSKHIIYLIITDGDDTTGKSVYDVKKLITDKRKEGEHFFLLSNGIGAKSLAQRLGIDVDFAANFSAVGDGFKIIFDSIERILWSLRSGGYVNRKWSETICLHEQTPQLSFNEIKLLTSGRNDSQ